MITAKSINERDTAALVEGIGVETVGSTVEVLNASTATFKGISDAGLVYITAEISNNNHSAVLSVHALSGNSTLTSLAASSLITITKDTASRLNVYFESGVLTVQNLLAGSVDANVNVKISM